MVTIFTAYIIVNRAQLFITNTHQQETLPLPTMYSGRKEHNQKERKNIKGHRVIVSQTDERIRKKCIETGGKIEEK